MSHRLGYGRWEELKWEIRKSWNFRFDWFIKSRKPAELESRFKTLVRVIQKELEGEELAKKTKKRSMVLAKSIVIEILDVMSVPVLIIILVVTLSAILQHGFLISFEIIFKL